jgi:hypothetical protein
MDNALGGGGGPRSWELDNAETNLDQSDQILHRKWWPNLDQENQVVLGK